MKNYKCCICGDTFCGWGNNPSPVVNDEDALCCDNCNSLHVIPARMAMIYLQKEKEENQDED